MASLVPTEKFLLIKAWGCGFWSDVVHVVGCLLFSEITGRIPVTQWGKRSLYNDGSVLDAFTQFFEPVSVISFDYLASTCESGSIYPADWNYSSLGEERELRRSSSVQDLIDRSETVLVSDCFISIPEIMPFLPEHHPAYGKNAEEVFRFIFEKYFVLRADIRNAVNEFYERNLQEGFAAIHLRGSDKIGEQHNLSEINFASAKALASIDRGQKIFLLTDDTRLIHAVKSIFGKRVVVTDSQRVSSTTGVHLSTSVWRLALGREILVDTYLAMMAESFIGNGGSNVAAVIATVKQWPEGCCLMMAPSRMLNSYRI